MAKNESKPSIQCNKCHKQIKYDRYYGYSHYCSGRVKDIYRAAYKKFCSIISIQNRDVQFFGMRDLANDLDSASVVYDTEANKLLRKENEMGRILSDEELENIVYDCFRHVAYRQMAANEKIREFYQMDDKASFDVSDLAKWLVQVINEEKQKAEIEALEHALEFMGQFPDFNLANMYEYIRDKEREIVG